MTGTSSLDDCRRGGGGDKRQQRAGKAAPQLCRPHEHRGDDQHADA